MVCLQQVECGTVVCDYKDKAVTASSPPYSWCLAHGRCSVTVYSTRRVNGWMEQRVDGWTDGRWKLLRHAPEDTQDRIRLAPRSGKDPSWGLRTWIPMLALPSPCYVAL